MFKARSRNFKYAIQAAAIQVFVYVSFQIYTFCLPHNIGFAYTENQKLPLVSRIKKKIRRITRIGIDPAEPPDPAGLGNPAEPGEPCKTTLTRFRRINAGSSDPLDQPDHFLRGFWICVLL